jgi:hypothetical protein
MVQSLQLTFASILLVTLAIAGAAPSSSIKVHDFVVPGAEVISITGIEATNVTVTTAPPISALNFCNVSVILSHPGANDSVLVEVWLPTKDWNGRFQATGGGGHSTGLGDTGLAPALAAGYAASQQMAETLVTGFT